MPVYAIGLERIIERGLIDPKEWEKIKRQVAMEIHADIVGRAARADEDPQVKFDYSKDWRNTPIPMGTIFGSDYDYWSYVANDALTMWKSIAQSFPPDFIAEAIAGQEPGWSRDFYSTAGLGIWENGNKTSFSAKLEGPRIDIGPTADFSLFLERWNYSKGRTRIGYYENLGVLHFIARSLQMAYQGIHTIYLMPIRPNSRADVKEIDGRKEPIKTLPIIRIVPRHYRAPQTTR